MDPADLGLEPGGRSAAPRRWRRSARPSPRTGSSSSSRPPATLALRNQLRHLAARQLLLRRRRRARASASPPRSGCSSPSPTGRSSAWSARARPSTRSPPSGAPPPTTCRSPSSSCATPSTRSSSGSRALEEVEGAPGLDLPALDVAAVAAGYGVAARKVETGDELRAALQQRSAPASPELVEVGGRARACGCSRAGRSMPMPLLTPKTSRIAPEPPAAPPADRADPEVADGTPSRCAASCAPLLGADRVAAARQRPRPLRLRRQPLPADPAGGRAWPRDAARRRRGCSPSGARSGTPLTFRAGGTSLNGQAQTDGILVDVRRHFGGVEVRRRRRRAPGRARHRARPRQPRPRPATAASSAPTRPRPTSPPSAA